MKTAKEYIESMREINHELYLFGKRVKNPMGHPIIRPTVNCVAATYELAHNPHYEPLLTTTSHLTGTKINRFCHIHQSVDDLVKKSKMCRALGAYMGSCFQRCVGMDALPQCPVHGNLRHRSETRHQAQQALPGLSQICAGGGSGLLRCHDRCQSRQKPPPLTAA